MQFTDAVSVSGTRRTSDGYLIADAKAVRTGIQTYLGSEVGKPDMAIVRVYRDEAEVRSVDSLRSFSHAPITVDHPSVSVNSENWKDLAVGEVSTAATWDGNRISLPLILKDAKAIAAVDGGKRELSAGYTCDLDWTPGKTAEGQAFDAQQKNIRANHVAIVGRGRAGSECRIGDAEPHKWGVAPINDHQPKEEIMTLKTVTVDGIPVEVTDQGATVIATLQTRLADANTKLTDADKAHQAVVATKDADLAKKDAEIDALKAKVLDEKALDAKVSARADLIGVAKSIAKDLKTEGLTDADIRKAAVVAKLGDASISGKPEAYIEARFDILADEAAKADPFAAAMKDKATGKITNDNGQAAYEARLATAWKGK